MDNELLKRVLSENSRIIIPGFGAFLRKEHGGAIVFSPFLRTDDGKLGAIIALEYGVSPQEAQTMIGEFAEKMRTILKVKSKYYIDGLGMLIVDNNGVVSFLEEEAKPAPRVAEPRVEPRVEPRAEPRMAADPVSNPSPGVAPGNAMPNVAHNPVSPASPLAMGAQRMAPSPIAVRQQPLQVPVPSPFARTTAPVAPIPAPIAQPTAPRPGPGARPAAANQRPQNNAPKAPQNPKRKIKSNTSKKSDMWLMIAILAAVVVIVLMVFGIMNASQIPPIE
ncbi:MAG: hypothetical protein RR980_05615 [Mucinivorans sp.]